jgi:hypothetical protein
MAERVAAPLKVPFLDLKTQYANLRNELLPGILECLDQAVYIDGEAVREFESSFAAYCETESCVGLASGTAALHLALLALDIGPGDEVIIPANTFIASGFFSRHLVDRPQRPRRKDYLTDPRGHRGASLRVSCGFGGSF